MLKNILMFIVVMNMYGGRCADLISYIVNCPERVNITDVTIFPKSQSSSYGYSIK